MQTMKNTVSLKNKSFCGEISLKNLGKYEGNIKVKILKLIYGDMEWTEVLQITARHWAFVAAVMNVGSHVTK
jgi:hypothetical protein